MDQSWLLWCDYVAAVQVLFNDAEGDPQLSVALLFMRPRDIAMLKEEAVAVVGVQVSADGTGCAKELLTR
jgi:hypothetical protein